MQFTFTLQFKGAIKLQAGILWESVSRQTEAVSSSHPLLHVAKHAHACCTVRVIVMPSFKCEIKIFLFFLLCLFVCVWLLAAVVKLAVSWLECVTVPALWHLQLLQAVKFSWWGAVPHEGEDSCRGGTQRKYQAEWMGSLFVDDGISWRCASVRACPFAALCITFHWWTHAFCLNESCLLRTVQWAKQAKQPAGMTAALHQDFGLSN